MIASGLSSSAPVQPIVVDIGNTATALGTWHGAEITDARHVPTNDMHAFGAALLKLTGARAASAPPVVVIASVVPSALAAARARAADLLKTEALVIGENVDLPTPLHVHQAETVGVDRVCCACAAFERTHHACCIISFGTAVTVDLVDEDGGFLGGAILPGRRLQARSLNEHTACLPLVDAKWPESRIGRDTAEAITVGICRGLVGTIRALVEGYAAELNHWPQVIATGGDMPLFAGRLDFVDSQVPDLCLIGVGIAYDKHTARERR